VKTVLTQVGSRKGAKTILKAPRKTQQSLAYSDSNGGPVIIIVLALEKCLDDPLRLCVKTVLTQVGSRKGAKTILKAPRKTQQSLA
jgi:hypothetical protein